MKNDKPQPAFILPPEQPRTIATRRHRILLWMHFGIADESCFSRKEKNFMRYRKRVFRLVVDNLRLRC